MCQIVCIYKNKLNWTVQC